MLDDSFHVFDTTLRDGAQREGMSLLGRRQARGGAAAGRARRRLHRGRLAGRAAQGHRVLRPRRAPSSTLRHAQLVAFGATRKAGARAADDPQVLALLDAETPVVCLVAKSDVRHVHQALRTTLEENLAMVADTVGFLVAEGRRVFLDCEHFFDGYAYDRDYGAAGAGGRVRRRRRRRRAVRHQRRHAADGHRPGGRRGGRADRRSGSASTAQDDTGCAVANSLAAVEAGATHVQGTANGYGERPGNADLFAVVGNLELKMGRRVLPEGCLPEMMRVAHAIAEIANMAPNPQQAYVGVSAFAHKAGLHASAIKVSPELYNHVDPALVGNDMRILVTEMAGRASVELKGRELGVDLSARPRRGRPGRRAGQGAGGRRLVVRGRRRLVRAAAARRARRGGRRPLFELESYGSSSSAASDGRGGQRGDREGARRAASGSSPPARATARSTRWTTRCAARWQAYYPQLAEMELADYKVRILDGRHGTDAVTRVLVETSDGVREWTTVGVHANVIEASWLALVDAASVRAAGRRRLSRRHARRPAQRLRLEPRLSGSTRLHAAQGFSGRNPSARSAGSAERGCQSPRRSRPRRPGRRRAPERTLGVAGAAVAGALDRRRRLPAGGSPPARNSSAGDQQAASSIGSAHRTIVDRAGHLTAAARPAPACRPAPEQQRRPAARLVACRTVTPPVVPRPGRRPRRGAGRTGGHGGVASPPVRIARFAAPSGQVASASSRARPARRPRRSPWPPSPSTRAAASVHRRAVRHSPTSGCWRRSCRARSSASARTTPSTPPRWAAATPPDAPLLFLKPSTSVIGPGDAIRLPVESAAGRPRGRARRRHRRAAAPARCRASGRWRRVFGYTFANDVTARDLQQARRAVDPGQGLRHVLPARPVDRDRRSTRPTWPITHRWTARSGRTGRTSQMIHDVADAGLVRLARHDAAARRRDPDRHAGRRRAARAPGRRVSVTIEGIGTLTNPVVAREPSRRLESPCAPDAVRVRFCPSPTGDLHVGNVRTRAVQLGVRPAHRRHVRAPDRGHRRRPQHRGVVPAACSSSCAGSAWTGTRDPRSAARTRRTGSRERLEIYRDVLRRLRDGRLRLRVATPPTEEVEGPPGRAAATRPRATTTTTATLTDGAGRRVPGRGPRSRCCGCGCRTSRSCFDDLVRGEVHVRAGARARLRARPGRRQPALPAGQPGRRRADGHHPRAARRGPAAVHAAADRAARARCATLGVGRADAAVRAPAVS